MDFQELHLKADDHRFANFPAISSVMSFSYVSKFDFHNSKDKSMAACHNINSRPDNHFVQGVGIMNFVPGFRTEHSQRFCDFSKTLNTSSNLRKFDSCSQFSTMNILSYLVGGFVGSKSQVGCTSMQGDRFQIWDLVWQKLIEIMGVNDNINNLGNCDDLIKFHEHSETEKCEKPVKQSYADVAKIVPSNLTDKSKQVKPVIKENHLKSNKQKKKQIMSTDCLYKGKLDFGRCEKKVSLQEMNSFSSSRWSNSRRKHCKKGVEKINRRDEREAAREGLDVVNQELDRCKKNTNESINFNVVGSIYLNNNNKKNVKISRKRTKKPGNNISNNNCDYVIDRENFKCVFNNNLGGLDKVNFANNCDFDSDLTTITSCNDNFRHRINSTCSVDSDDSFIVFDKSSNCNEDPLINFYCSDSDIQTDDDSTITSEDSDSDSFISLNNSTVIDKPSACIKNEIKHNNCNRYHPDNDSLINQHPYKYICKIKRKVNGSEIIPGNVPYTAACSSPNLQSYNKSNSTKLSTDNGNDKYMKCRSASECSLESEDSFITFGSSDDTEDEDVLLCSSKSVGECDHVTVGFVSSSQEEEFDSDEDFDQYNCAVLTSYAPDHSYDTKLWLEEVNHEWGHIFNKNVVDKKKTNSKKVHFPPDDKLTKVKKLLTWNFALRAARVGPWEELARDTMRFQNRICSVGEILQNVLNNNHRQKIYKERFSNLYEK